MLETLLGNLPGAVYRCRNDRDRTMLFASEGCYDLTGFSPGELVGNRGTGYGRLIHPDDQPRVWDVVQSALREQRAFELRYRIRTAGGAEKSVWERGRGVFAQQGTLEAIEGFITDVTELDRAEAAARESEEKFAKAFLASPDAILLSDLETGCIIDVNESFERISGWSRAEAVGRTTLELDLWMRPEDRASLLEAIGRKGLREFVVQMRRRDGEVREVVGAVEVTEINRRPSLIIVSHDQTERRRAEMELRDSQEKFAKAFRASPGAMAISEPGGRGFIEVNDGYTRMFGYTREELLGRRTVDLGLWAHADERVKFLAEFRAHGSVRDMEVVRRCRDGREATCLISAESLQLGGRQCIVTALYDISDRMRAEAARRESEEKLAKAFRAVPDAVFITELESGKVIETNEGCHRLYGYAREESIGRTTGELGLFHNPQDRVRLMQALQEAGGVVRDFELLGHNRAGDVLHVIASCEIIEMDRKPHLVTIAHDITARKRAELALRESEARFAAAFRAGPGGLAISDIVTRKFVEVNDRYGEIFGYSRDEMIGRTALELGLWADLDERDQFFEELLSSGRVREKEVVSRRRGGERIHCVVSAEPIEVGGKGHLLTVVYDVTVRKRAEEARIAAESQLRQTQKLDALGQLAGGIAHDFNNILTAIVANTELALMDVEQPAETRIHLAEVRRATKRATDLVRQILAFSRQGVQEQKPIRLAVVVLEALKLLRSTLPKTLQIVEQVDPAAPVVLADATQVHQVMMNLCINAAQAMRDRPGRLTVKLETLDVPSAGSPDRPKLAPGRYARLVVADTGHGMDAATLNKIFEPFFTTKGPGEGTGLGLAVVHGIVEKHAGDISVRSHPGEGTTFEICLPEHGARGSEKDATSDEPPRGRGERILLVDDEAPIAAVTAELLKRLGYRVWSYSDPVAARTAFDAAPTAFDAVLTDLSMPQLTGIEFARHLHAQRPDLPVLLLTGRLGAWIPETLQAEGVRRVIMKPLTTAKLAHALREVLDQRRPSSA